MTTWIAEEQVVFVHPDGSRQPGRIAIGAPAQRELDCACQVALDGMERSVVIFGDSTLQALLLGARFLGTRLHDFRSRGGRVLYPPEAVELVGEDQDVALEALFGSFLAEPTPTPKPSQD